ncbi:RNA-binding protein [Phenylobacterium soli]|uniref:RNA-binding protein n=1 Tax=Phenylobacterium soli TaxID=2170551 RepID=A0A328AKT9_9CAUL|nr:RNA-binding protein [Phenylobacterium soli]RAK53478.1 RNA-binding protein [Phenylobacterium soli]
MAAETKAAADRERRDIVSGEVMEEEALIRFVAGPDGLVTPDLARKLPGRGLWVAADRASVEAAAKKNLFSRAAKAKLAPPGDLATQVEILLKRRLLAGLGLARKAGELTSGFEKVSQAITSQKTAWLIEASDGAHDGRRKLWAMARKQPRVPGLIGVFTAAELGLALGLENVIHTAFLAGRAAERWAQDVHRLSGFCPLLPESWREEP